MVQKSHLTTWNGQEKPVLLKSHHLVCQPHICSEPSRAQAKGRKHNISSFHNRLEHWSLHDTWQEHSKKWCTIRWTSSLDTTWVKGIALSLYVTFWRTPSGMMKKIDICTGTKHLHWQLKGKETYMETNERNTAQLNSCRLQKIQESSWELT